MASMMSCFGDAPAAKASSVRLYDSFFMVRNFSLTSGGTSLCIRMRASSNLFSSSSLLSFDSDTGSSAVISFSILAII